MRLSFTIGAAVVGLAYAASISGSCVPLTKTGHLAVDMATRSLDRLAAYERALQDYYCTLPELARLTYREHREADGRFLRIDCARAKAFIRTDTIGTEP